MSKHQQRHPQEVRRPEPTPAPAPPAPVDADEMEEIEDAEEAASTPPAEAEAAVVSSDVKTAHPAPVAGRDMVDGILHALDGTDADMTREEFFAVATWLGRDRSAWSVKRDERGLSVVSWPDAQKKEWRA